LYRILSSYWLAHFYLIQKSAKVLHYFGLDCGMLEFLKYYTQAVLQRTISRIFRGRFGGKDCGLGPYNPSAKEVGGLKVFLYAAAQNY
jgi:hypothetical protein